MFYGTAAASMREVERAVRASIGSGANRDRADSDIYGAARRTVAIGVPLLYGTGFIADQSYFGESWIAWFYTPAGPESPQRLYIDMDLYDFATAPWRPDDPGDDSPIHTGHAYVDASGTNENIITFSKRVIIAGNYVPPAAVAAEHLHRGPAWCGHRNQGTILATDLLVRRALPGVPWWLCMGLAGEDPDQPL